MTPFVRNPLTRVWLLLLGLCVLTVGLGLMDGSAPLGTAGVAALLLPTVVKGRQILLCYLDLRHAGSGWRNGLSAWLVITAGAILAIYAAGEQGLFGG